MTAREAVLERLREVRDPEIPALDVVEMGIVHDVEVGEAGVNVVLTPTYSGCPAMRAIEEDVVACLERHGYDRVAVRISSSPRWTTERLGPGARRKLEESGIAPPPPCCRATGGLPSSARCPRCGEATEDLVSAFGSTACKALWRCRACGEPFELFKAI